MARRRTVGVSAGVAAVVLVAGVVAVAVLGGDDPGRRPDEVLPPATDSPASVTAVAWSADGSELYVVGDGGIEILSGSPLARTGRLASGMLSPEASWNPDHTLVALADTEGPVLVYDLVAGDVLPGIDTGGVSGHPAWSPDGERIVTAAADGTVAIRDARTGEVAASFAPFDPGIGVTGLSWPSADRIVAVSTTQAITVEVATGEVPWRHSSGPAGLLEASPDGDQVVVAQQGTHGHDVYSVESGDVLGTVDTDSRVLVAADWSPDGRWLLATGDDEAPRLWDATDAETVDDFPMVGPYGAGGAWSPDSRRVALADAYDQEMLVIDVTGRADDEELSIAEDEVITATAWSPAGDRLAAVGRDGTVFVWAFDG